jgi:hypothetical protein
VVGCCSETTSSIHLIAFRPNDFILQIENFYYGPDWPVVIDYHTLVEDFGLHELPAEYRFGVSGRTLLPSFFLFH